MFTILNAKKVLFTPIVSGLVLCLFVIMGCFNGGPSQDPPPDAVLRVGDKLSPFSLSDIAKSSSGLSWVYGDESTHEGSYGPNVRFPKKGVWVELKNGTRYVCVTSGGCRISLTNSGIIEGEIEVYYNKKQ